MSFGKAELDALRALRIVWPDQEIVLIGASALDRWLPLEHRQTYDLDLVVNVDPRRMRDELRSKSHSPTPDHKHVVGP